MVSIEGFLKHFESKATKVGYRTSLTQYFAFLNVDPDTYFDLFKQARKGTMEDCDEALEKYKGDVSDWIADMRSKNIAPKSIQCKSGATRSYLLENHIDLGRPFWKRLKVCGQARTVDRVPTKEELQKTVNHLDLFGRAVLYTQISTGARLEDIQTMQIKNIDFTKTPTRVFYYCKKIRRWLYGFLTKEATIVVKEWLNNRETYLVEFYKTTYKLLPTRERATKRKTPLRPNALMREDITFEEFCKRQNTKSEGILFPVTRSTIYQRYWDALDKAGIGQKDEQTGIRFLHDHTLRKYAYTQASRAVQPLVAEALIGHTKGLNALEAIYGRHRDNIDELAKDFLKAEPYLSLTIEVLPTTELEQVNQRLENNEKKLEIKGEKLDTIAKANEDHFQIIQTLLKKIDELQAEIDHRNKAIIDQRELEWQQRIESEIREKEAKIRAFQQGSELIIQKMIASGRSVKEIEQYRKTIEHGLTLF
jgi:hypothetical protein